MWIRRRFLREGSAASTCRTVREGFRERALSGAAREAGLRTPWPSRAMPTTIEEVIASLESEAQLASDQTVRELIQSVLGPNYDLKTEEISSMGKMHWHKASQAQADQGLQVFQQKVLEELPEGVPSVLQIEQEDIFEWGVSEAESLLFKPQETLEVQAADESSKPLEDEAPAGDSKAAKWVSLKVKSSELLQIRGKEVKRTRKSILGLPQQRQKKSSKLPRDQKLPKQKIPPDYSTPTLHDLCATVPARELPIDLRLASRVYHTASKKGHSPLLGLFGTSFSGDPSTDEEQRDRILQGVPVTENNQEYVAVLPTASGVRPELAPGTRQRAHKPDLQLLGEEVSAYPGFTKLFWNLTSPKFSVPVSVMRETLYPKYESVQASRILTEKFSSENKENVIILDQYSKSSRRVKSAVELRKEETIAPLEIKDDMQSNIKQVMFQKARELERQMTAHSETEERTSVKENIDTILDNLQTKRSVKELSHSLIEASRKAGITYIVYPKKKKLKQKKGLKLSKLTMVYDELSKPPKTITRSRFISNCFSLRNTSWFSP
nr:PREDICTED: uncharacterized protein LOC103551698 [Equus przewalskii]